LWVFTDRFLFSEYSNAEAATELLTPKLLCPSFNFTTSLTHDAQTQERTVGADLLMHEREWREPDLQEVSLTNSSARILPYKGCASAVCSSAALSHRTRDKCREIAPVARGSGTTRIHHHERVATMS
jgi:hypothetical protein